MSRRLTVHAGVNKTGSSAIQEFLKHNCESLRGQGVVVPNEHLDDSPPVEGHHVWYFDRPSLDVDAQGAELTAKLDALFSDAGIRQVVISAENLSNYDNDAFKWFAAVARNHEIEVVVYLRRQDEFLLSSWQQWFQKVYPDFWTWLISAVGVMADWRTVLERWERVVGRGGIRARLYEPRRLRDGDVITDFSQFLFADPASLDGTGMQAVNPSFTEAIADLTRGSDLFENGHDSDFYDFLADVLGSSSHRRQNESIVTFDQRMAILDRYARSNAWVREQYFPTDDVPVTLFEQPSPTDYVVQTREELTREQIQMLARLVFELSRRRTGRLPGGGTADSR
jgi:hypothetical protein